MIKEIKDKKDLPKFIPENKQTLELFLKTLVGISEKEEELVKKFEEVIIPEHGRFVEDNKL